MSLFCVAFLFDNFGEDKRNRVSQSLENSSWKIKLFASCCLSLSKQNNKLDLLLTEE